jgi:hypothetical protein
MEKETDDIITKLEAPALSCIIATICALAISELHSNNSVTFAGLYWLIFLVSRSPCVRTSRLAKNAPPVTVAWISALVARPETVPDTLRVASLQVPEIAPPSKITLLLISSL